VNSPAVVMSCQRPNPSPRTRPCHRPSGRRFRPNLHTPARTCRLVHRLVPAPMPQHRCPSRQSCRQIPARNCACADGDMVNVAAGGVDCPYPLSPQHARYRQRATRRRAFHPRRVGRTRAGYLSKVQDVHRRPRVEWNSQAEFGRMRRSPATQRRTLPRQRRDGGCQEDAVDTVTSPQDPVYTTAPSRRIPRSLVGAKKTRVCSFVPSIVPRSNRAPPLARRQVGATTPTLAFAGPGADRQ